MKLEKRTRTRNEIWKAGWADYFENRPEGMSLTDAILFDLVLAANALMETHNPNKRDGDEWKA